MKSSQPVFLVRETNKDDLLINYMSSDESKRYTKDKIFGQQSQRAKDQGGGGSLKSAENMGERLQNDLRELYAEYVEENERVIPAVGSRVLYQCLHPLQDLVQDADTHLVHQDSNDGIERDKQDPHRKIFSQSYSNYEYLLILEEIAEPRIDSSTSEGKDIGVKHYPTKVNLVPNKQQKQAKKDLIQEENRQTVTEFIRIPQNKRRTTTIQNEDYRDSLIQQSLIQSEIEFDEPDPIKEHVKGTQHQKKETTYEHRSWITQCSYTDSNQRQRVNTFFDENISRKFLQIQNQIEQTSLIMEQDQANQEGSEPLLYKRYILNMWRIDLQQKTQLLISQQSFTIWDQDALILNNKFHFSVDGSLIYIILKCRKTNSLLKTISFDSLSLQNLDKFNIDMTKISTVFKERNLQGDPVLYIPKANNQKQLEERKSQEFVSHNISQLKPCLIMYLQDFQNGNLIVKDNYDYQHLEFPLKQQSLMHQESKILNIFFGVSTGGEIDDSMIILQEYTNKESSNDQGEVSIFKTHIMNVQAIIDYLIQQDEGGDQVSLFDLPGMSRPTDFTMDEVIPINLLKIKRSFYHKQIGIVIEMSEILVDQSIQQFLEPAEMEKKKRLIILPQSKLYQKIIKSQAKVLSFNQLQLPINPQLQNKLCFIEKSKGREYMAFFEDLIYNKGSFDQTLLNGSVLDLGAQYTDDHQGAPESQNHYVDFISNFDFQKRLSFSRIDMEPLDEHVRRPIINIYQNYIETQGTQIRIEGTNIKINDPYIITVTDQVTLNIYSMIDPNKLYILKLENHFEFFLEITDDEVWIKQERYYKHQVIMFQVMDLKSNAHRIQALILPSYIDMAAQSQPFQLMTFPFKYHLEKDQYRNNDRELQQIQMSADNVVAAHFLQLREPSHYKDNQIDDKSSNVIYNLQRSQIIILIQMKNKIVLYEFNVENGIGQVLAENCVAEHKILRVKDSFGRIRDHVCDLKNSIKSDDFHNPERLKDKVGDPKFFYFVTSEQGVDSISLLHINFPELLSTEQVLTLPMNILEYQLSSLDLEQTSLLLLDQNFFLHIYSPSYSKLSNLSLVLKKTSPQLTLAQTQWIFLKSQDSKIQCTVKRHIKITDNGIYIDNMFYRNVTLDEFEEKRDRLVSTQLLNNKDEAIVHLNESGVLDTGNVGSEHSNNSVYYYRKIKQINNSIQIANRAGRVMLSKKNSFMNAQINKAIQEMAVNYQTEFSFYFLVLPDLTSRKKNLLPFDSLAKREIEFSTFIGDDIILKSGNALLIFNSQGSILPLTSQNSSNSNINLSQYRVTQFIHCEDEGDSQYKMLLINTKDQLFSVLTLIRSTSYGKNLYSVSYEIAGDPLMPRSEDRSVVNPNQYHCVIKLAHKTGQLMRLFIAKKIKQDENQLKNRAASIQIFRRITLQFRDDSEITNDQANQIIFYVSYDRKDIIEQTIRDKIVQQFQFQEKVQSKDQQKKQKLQKEDRNDSHSQSQFEKRTMIRLSIKNQMQLRKEENDEELLLENQQNLSEDQKNQGLLEVEFKEFDLDFISNTHGEYVFKIKNCLYLIKRDHSIKLNINLNSTGYISQLQPVQRQNQIQFMYYDNKTRNFHLFIWDLETNQERLMYVFKQNSHNPFYVISRGVSINDNYLFFVGQNSFQDLRLNFSSNQFMGSSLWPRNIQSNLRRSNQERLAFIQEKIASIVDDIKMGRDSKKSLGLLKGQGLAELHRTYSFIDLQYIKYLMLKYTPGVLNNAYDNKKDAAQQVELELDHLKIIFPKGLNILHYFATEVEFIRLFLQEVNEPERKKYTKDFIFYPLHPSLTDLYISNSVKARRPLSFALKTNSSQCFELQIQILQSNQSKNGHSQNMVCILDHLRPYLQTLLIYKSPFVRSLVASRCHYYLYSIKVEGEKFKTKDIFSEMPTMYIDDKKENELSQGGIVKSKNKNIQEFEQIEVKRTIKTADFAHTLIESYSKHHHQGIESEDDKFTDQAIKSQNKRKIFFYAYDFSGLLEGPKSESFLRFLINQKENLSIFELRYIQALLNYRWNAIRRPYFVLLILIILKIIIMMFYIVSQQSLINCYQSATGAQLEQEYNCSQSIFIRMRDFEYWDDFNFGLQVLLLIIQCYVTHKEMNKFLKIRTFTQALVLFFNYLHIVKLLADKLLLYIFTEIVIEFNLQSDFQDGFSKIDKRYQDRYATFFIYLIRFGNALLFITLPLIFFFKIRFQPFITVSLPRFFMASQKVLQLIGVFLLITLCLYYSLDILSSMRYLLGDTQEDEIYDPSIEYIHHFVLVIRYINLVFRYAMISLIFTIIVVMFQFIGTTITRHDANSTNNVELEKYRNLASLLLEDTSFLQTQTNSTKKHSAKSSTRYVVQAQLESSQTMSRGEKKNRKMAGDDIQYQVNQELEMQGGTSATNEELIRIVKEMLIEERKEISKMIASAMKEKEDHGTSNKKKKKIIDE